MRALIVANGEPPSSGLMRELASSASLIVAADGGLEAALGAGLNVDAVVGDREQPGAEALDVVTQETFDCVVLDLRLPDMTGFDILERMRDLPQVSDLPVVVFTGKELSPEEDARLHTLARSVVVKGVESPERLLD